MPTLNASTDVSGLQFDIVTTGTLSLTLGDDFTFDYEGIDTNTYRVLIWTLGEYTFSGEFMTVSADCTTSSIIGSDLDGDEVDVDITQIGISTSTLLLSYMVY